MPKMVIMTVMTTSRRPLRSCKLLENVFRVLDERVSIGSSSKCVCSISSRLPRRNSCSRCCRTLTSSLINAFEFCVVPSNNTVVFSYLHCKEFFSLQIVSEQTCGKDFGLTMKLWKTQARQCRTQLQCIRRYLYTTALQQCIHRHCNLSKYHHKRSCNETRHRNHKCSMCNSRLSRTRHYIPTFLNTNLFISCTQNETRSLSYRQWCCLPSYSVSSSESILVFGIWRRFCR